MCYEIRGTADVTREKRYSKYLPLENQLSNIKIFKLNLIKEKY